MVDMEMSSSIHVCMRREEKGEGSKRNRPKICFGSSLHSEEANLEAAGSLARPNQCFLASFLA